MPDLLVSIELEQREKYRKDLIKACKKAENRLKKLTKEELKHLNEWFARPLIMEYSRPE